MRRGHRERGGGSQGDGSGDGGSATDHSSRRVGQDDKKTKEKLDDARGKVAFKSRVSRHMRIRGTKIGAGPEPAAWEGGAGFADSASEENKARAVVEIYLQQACILLIPPQ